jgi:glycosyltransferase involved in cell wall biosynthesis
MPKFSILTPTYNSKEYLAETIDSVISQKGDFEIEYIIVDGGSVDGTQDVVGSYLQGLKEKKILINCRNVEIIFNSQKDDGMYDAINRGFKLASGDYCAWINSDDIYLPGAFHTVSTVFDEYADVKWLKGITSYINNSSMIYKNGKPYVYSQAWITLGVYGRLKQFVQQDSVFWRSQLWSDVKGIDKSLKLAGDFYLWREYSEREQLYSINANISCFRKVKGQLSSNIGRYRQEMDSICNVPKPLSMLIRIYNGLERILPNLVMSYIGFIFFGNQVFYAVKIGSDGSLEKITGNYRDTERALSE